MTNQKHDMLVASPERWDEACFAVPAVRALMASGLGVGVICSQNQSALWQSLPGLQVIAVPSTAKPKAIAAEINASWQAALIWEDGPLAEAIARAAIARRLGPSVGKLPKRLTHPLTATVAPIDHRVRFYLTTVEEMGVHTSDAEFFAPADFGVDRSAKSVLLVPDTDFGTSHEWPLDRWKALGEHLIKQDRAVTIAVGNDGRKLGAALADHLAGEASPLVIPSLSDALPQLATYSLVITADGSLPHLAAYAGATCITLFGPNDPQWKRPLGKRHAVVHRHVECAPCLLAKCPLDLRCQNELKLETVISIADEWLIKGDC